MQHLSLSFQIHFAPPDHEFDQNVSRIKYSVILAIISIDISRQRRTSAGFEKLTHHLGKVIEIFSLINPFPHTTNLQQTTLNIFCQKIENLYN